jgi:hypothetical protein
MTCLTATGQNHDNKLSILRAERLRGAHQTATATLPCISFVLKECVVACADAASYRHLCHSNRQDCNHDETLHAQNRRGVLLLLFNLSTSNHEMSSRFGQPIV